MTLMPKINSISVEESKEFMPATLAPGLLYVSKRFKTAAHLCACGCGTKVVTPLKPGGWTLSSARSGGVSLDPSIGNFNLPCQSHYWIRDGGVEWAHAWSPTQIAAGRAHDHALRQAHFDQKQIAWWRRFARWLKGLFEAELS